MCSAVYAISVVCVCAPTPNYAGEHLLKLYKRVLGSKSQADVSYLTWVNMNRFFRTAAKKLSSAIDAYLKSSAEQ